MPPTLKEIKKILHGENYWKRFDMAHGQSYWIRRDTRVRLYQVYEFLYKKESGDYLYIEAVAKGLNMNFHYCRRLLILLAWMKEPLVKFEARLSHAKGRNKPKAIQGIRLV